MSVIISAVGLDLAMRMAMAMAKGLTVPPQITVCLCHTTFGLLQHEMKRHNDVGRHRCKGSGRYSKRLLCSTFDFCIHQRYR